jgi:hypothetical protein
MGCSFELMMLQKSVTVSFKRATMNVNANPLTVHSILWKHADWFITQLSHGSLSTANVIYN